MRVQLYVLGMRVQLYRTVRLGGGLVFLYAGYRMALLLRRLQRRVQQVTAKVLIAPPHFLIMPAAGRASIAGEVGRKGERVQGRRELQGLRLHVLDDQLGWSGRASAAALSLEPQSASVAFTVPAANAAKRVAFRSLGDVPLSIAAKGRYVLIDATCDCDLQWSATLHVAEAPEEALLVSSPRQPDVWEHGFSTQANLRATHRLPFAAFAAAFPSRERVVAALSPPIMPSLVTGLGFACQLRLGNGLQQPIRLVVHGVRVSF